MNNNLKQNSVKNIPPQKKYFESSFYLKLKLPERLQLDHELESTEQKEFASNYCRAIVLNKNNVITFRINLLINSILTIVNLAQIALFICVYIIININFYNFFIPMVILTALNIATAFFQYSGEPTYKKYTVHNQYLNCKFALMNKTEAAFDIKKIKKIYESKLIKFIDDDKFDIKNKENLIQNKQISKHLKWLLTIGWSILDVLLCLSNYILFVIAIFHHFVGSV